MVYGDFATFHNKQHSYTPVVEIKDPINDILSIVYSRDLKGPERKRIWGNLI